MLPTLLAASLTIRLATPEGQLQDECNNASRLGDVLFCSVVQSKEIYILAMVLERATARRGSQ